MKCSIQDCVKPAHCKTFCVKHYRSLRAHGDPLAARTNIPRTPVLPSEKATRAIWHDMRNRCLNKNNKDFHRYGGRGITVCDRWLTFRNFIADMGPRPDGLTIEREDNDRGYEPSNCRWATHKEQCRNTSNTIRVQLDGETLSLIGACERLGLKYQNVRQRLLRGKSMPQALETQRATAKG